MKMSLDAKSQILFESFEMFKDNWESNTETLKNTIYQVATFDISTALQMWMYLLNNNAKIIKTDSGITSEILDGFNEDAYDDIISELSIIDAIFKKACEPWKSVSIIRYCLIHADYYTANMLLENIAKNKTISEYNYTEYKSSNVATCIYCIMNCLCNFNEDDMTFFLEWIERIEDKGEKMKLKVLMLSKEQDLI